MSNESDFSLARMRYITVTAKLRNMTVEGR
jgi:hypothetical protein